MFVKIGINGFGCIGCLVFCCILEFGEKLSDIEVVVINDLILFVLLVYFLKYDLIYGILNVDVLVIDDLIVVNGKNYCVYVEL